MFKPKPQKPVFFRFAFRRIYALIGLLVVASSLLLTLLASSATATAANPTLNFQARLESSSGGIAPDGNYNVQFNLYEGGTSTGGGTKVWTENRLASNSQAVRVANGYLTVNLGDVTAFPGTINWDEDLFLSMDIGNTASCTITTDFDTDCGGDGEMTPYLKLTSVPYAFQSKSAEQLTQAQTSYTGSLQFQTLTGGNQTFELTDQGAAGTYTLLTQNMANGSYIQNQTASPQAAGFNIQASSGVTGTITGTSAGSSTALVINTGATSNVGLVVNAAAGQTVDLLQLQDSGGNVNASFDDTGAMLTLGRTSNLTGQIALANSGSSYMVTVQGLAQTVGDGTLNIPDLAGTTDTLCLVTLANCAAAAGSYINNGTSLQVGANFNIDGTGTAGILQAATIDTPSGTTTLNVGTTNATSIHLMKNTTITGNLTLAEGANRTIDVQARTTNAVGNDLTISAGDAGTGASAFSGGKLTLQGGDAAGTGNANGGDVLVVGGLGTGTGVQGLVTLGATNFTSVSNTVCAANCTVDQANVDGYGVVLVDASTPGITITLPDPTRSDIGRVVYVTGSATSLDFTLEVNSGADLISVAMRSNTTATMIWNGTDWTPGGASNATTLQATYNNGSNPSTVPEILLDGTHGTIDIQDADTSIGQDIFDIRGSNGGLGGLGTVLFGVSSSGQVTIQNTTDQDSSFRVLKSNGDYVINVNSSNGYIINNSTSAAGNVIVNPGFESGGNITGGEEGWFGPAQSSIANSAANAHSGNYVMQVTPNGTQLDVYAGTYYQVTPGDSLNFEGYVKNSAGTNGTAGIEITWYDKDKAVLSSTTNFASLPGTSYVLRQINGTAPANAVYARVSAVVGSGATTGTFYFDDFYLKRSVESAQFTFRNSVDSSTAFRIQSAGSTQTLFNADTANNIIKIGDSTGTNTDTTILVLDSATADPTTLTNKNGGLFYRSDTGSLKAIINGAVVDVCTTAVTCAGYSASASSSIQLQTGATPGTQQSGFFNISGVGYLTGIQTQNLASGNTSNLTILTGNAASGNSGNITIDTGTASGTTGSITIGHNGVTTDLPGGVLQLGTGGGSGVNGSILFRNTGGSNTMTLTANGGNPVASWSLILPQDPGNSGDCLKGSNGTGTVTLAFSSCTSGVTTTLQDAYNNSSSPAGITLADSKNMVITAQDTTTDPSVLINLQCTTCSSNGGRFAIQNAGTDVFTVKPNNGGIVLGINTQVGSATTDYTTLTLFQLDSYDGTSGGGETSCVTSVYGAMYYNSTTGTIRSCTTTGWADITNPEQLGLMSYGIVPSSGNDPYDLAATGTNYVSGPCRVSWSSLTDVHWESCVAYSGGKRVAVTAGSVTITTTTANNWQHLCLTGTNSQPALSTASSSETANMPTFSLTAPVVCLADIKNDASTSGRIGDLYDTRTFTSDLKEAITTTTAVGLGMLVDASTSGISPAAAGSAKLYATVVATDGSTSSTTPNTIVTTMGPAWVKATAGTAGQFVKTAGGGYANTTAAIPNNSFYYSAGNTRTAYDTTCTAASNCSSSLYVNFNVR